MYSWIPGSRKQKFTYGGALATFIGLVLTIVGFVQKWTVMSLSDPLVPLNHPLKILGPFVLLGGILFLFIGYREKQPPPEKPWTIVPYAPLPPVPVPVYEKK